MKLSGFNFNVKIAFCLSGYLNVYAVEMPNTILFKLFQRALFLETDCDRAELNGGKECYGSAVLLERQDI